ncbi:hypothetical protein [Clostridium beijerinckii]|uniref:Uncharacterized protein n=1 Tax=Clostridium beijerinckii TaxID=1520 RepID=A0AAW3W6T7_CLOBE|nr:hypothetical protein [Clostridium beijerinckii]MBC2457521.1 hypothetical protein [Clostridium beijerinckii]MBC2474654.1 hypothetical protein [Clostridium beijerinckii]NOV62389.1 hypothetical protein [Clostridium beijerinckii]NOV68114.1 hypothetical protein [Clostridium beijerinckii]NOW30441.1 hypothetical protein [Clostridium beijerinckii]
MKVSKRLNDMCYRLESTYNKMLGNLISNSFKIDKNILKYFEKIERKKIDVANEISKNLRNKFKVKIVEVKEFAIVVELKESCASTTELRDNFECDEKIVINKDKYEDRLRVLFMKQGFIEIKVIDIQIDNNQIYSKIELGGMAPRDEYYIGWDEKIKGHKVMLKIDVIEKKH